MYVQTSDRAAQEARARRARAIIIVVMAVFIVAPVVVWLLAGTGVRQSP
jgi:hypothetical protein